MCGIFGYNQASEESRNGIFFADLAHRGPDAAATCETGSWTLGHLRLSIIETSSASNQPFLKGGNALVFNGEIYNYLELSRDHLSNEVLRTASDTEVLITLLNRDGLSCLNRLNGMFAFAWHNGKTDTLHLVRDRFGVKPLYYTSVGGHVYFSSEITPLARLQKNIQLDDGIIASFMADTATDFDERSGVVGIRQVRPGHYLQITADGSVAEVPWYHGQDSVIDTALFNDKEKTLAAFEDLLTDALRLRHRADVPICITLSGGLDSTSLYVLAKEKLQSKIQPFVFAHPGAATDESGRAIALARAYGDEPIVITSQPGSGLKALTEALRHLEWPIWNPSAVAYLDMYRAIKAHGYTVVIEGHGSDEQLGGYPYMIEAAWKQALLTLRFKFAHTLYRTWLGTQNTALGQQPAASSLSKDIVMMTRGLLRGVAKTLLAPRKWKYLSFNALVGDSFNYKILPIVLRTFDRLPMAASLEARCPFMDYRVVEFIRALPLEYKVNEIGSKAILREVLKKYGHASIYQNRAKMGFASDIPTLLNETATRAALTSAVERFNHPAWHTQKTKAEALLKKKLLTWDDVTPIWKVAAVTMIEDYYGQPH
jgi:asparagine synthase (glutamine-hydrolysing)